MSTPLRALLAAAAVAAPAPAAGDRWTLSSGQPVSIVVEGLNNDQPILLIVELSSLIVLPSLPVLLDHRTGWPSGGELAGVVLLGAWDDIRVETVDGLDRLTAVPRWLQLPPVPENTWDAYGVERDVLLKIEQKMPVQASGGFYQVLTDAKSGFYRVTEAATINGRAVAPSTDPRDPPLYVARFVQCKEGSVVLFGADDGTGPNREVRAALAARLSASRHHQPSTTPPKELTMAEPTAEKPRLKSLLALYKDHKALVADLVAEGVADDVIKDRVHAAELTARDERINAQGTEITTLKADLAKAPGTPTVTKPATITGNLPAGAGGGAGGSGDDQAAAPANLMAACRLPQFAELKGPARVAAVVKEFPQLATVR